MKRLDNYIRKHTQKDIEVPEGLSWEEMNIPLPVKKKKNRRYFWLFLFAGILIGSGITYVVCSTSAVKDQPQAEVQKNHKNAIIGNAQIQTANDTKQPSTVPADQANKNDIPYEQESEGAETLNLTSVSSDDIIPSNVSTNNLSEATVLAEKREYVEKSFSPLEEAAEASKQSSAEKKIEESQEIEGFEKINAKIPPVLDSKEKKLPEKWSTDNNKDQKKPNRWALFLDAGYSYGQNHYSNGEQAGVLNAAESQGHGFTFNIGTRFYLKNNFFINAALGFQKLHADFMYVENLGTEPGASKFESITRLRHLCHTNHFISAGMKLGMGKDFFFTKRLGGQMIASLSSDYQIRSNGTVINEDLSIYELNDHQAIDRFIYHFHSSVGLFWQMKTIRFIGTIGWQQGMFGAQLFEGSTLEYSPRVLNCSIGIQKKL